MPLPATLRFAAGALRVGGDLLTKTQNPPNAHALPTPGPATAPLAGDEATLLNTMRSLGALKAAEGVAAERLERRVNLKHGPFMHALRELERKGYVARVAARKDVLFHVK